MFTLRALLVAIFLMGASAVAQITVVQAKPLTDEDVKLIRADVQQSKDQIIKDTMEFTEPEATAFWPIYKQYASQQTALADRRLKVITEYARAIEKMDDATAKDLTQRFLKIEDDTQDLRRNFYPTFEKAIGAKRAAKFFQVDNRLTMIINVQLASEIPLIP